MMIINELEILTLVRKKRTNFQRFLSVPINGLNVTIGWNAITEPSQKGYKHFKSLVAAAAADVLPRAISVRLNCITVYLRDCISKTAIQDPSAKVPLKIRANRLQLKGFI
jgi:predicted DNA-binding WGR domain protein